MKIALLSLKWILFIIASILSSILVYEIINVSPAIKYHNLIISLIPTVWVCWGVVSFYISRQEPLVEFSKINQAIHQILYFLLHLAVFGVFVVVVFYWYDSTKISPPSLTLPSSLVHIPSLSSPPSLNPSVPSKYESAPAVHTVISSIDDCLKLKKSENKTFNPVAYSSDQTEQQKINDVQNAPESDNCIFNFVDKHEDIKDKTVCDKIQTNYYKNLCLQRIVIHLKDPSMCTLSFLHEQSNVDGCFNMLAYALKDKSLCEKPSNPITVQSCLSNFDK